MRSSSQYPHQNVCNICCSSEPVPHVCSNWRSLPLANRPQNIYVINLTNTIDMAASDSGDVGCERFGIWLKWSLQQIHRGITFKKAPPPAASWSFSGLPEQSVNPEAIWCSQWLGRKSSEGKMAPTWLYVLGGPEGPLMSLPVLGHKEMWCVFFVCQFTKKVLTRNKMQ